MNDVKNNGKTGTADRGAGISPAEEYILYSLKNFGESDEEAKLFIADLKAEVLEEQDRMLTTLGVLVVSLRHQVAALMQHTELHCSQIQYLKDHVDVLEQGQDMTVMHLEKVN